MPLFSIVIPVYRGQEYLTGCVESLLAQQMGDFEALLIDDGSPDGSGVLCDELAARDSRLRVIHKPNGGVTSARNRGIEEARGRWLLFLDQDDRFYPHTLRLIAAALDAARPGELISWPLSTWPDVRELTGEPYTRFSLSELGRFYAWGTTHYVWTKLFDLAWLRAHPEIRFDESIQDGTDDLPFCNLYCRSWFSAAPAGGVLLINTASYYYETRNENSVSNRLQPLQPWHLTMFWDLFTAYTRQYGVPPADMRLVLRQCLRTLAFGVYSSREPQRQPAVRALLRDPRLREMLDYMKRNRLDSPFYGAFRLRRPGLIRRLSASAQGTHRLLDRMDRADRLLRRCPARQ